jgi:uncharacterized protein (TIGR04255 family)
MTMGVKLHHPTDIKLKNSPLVEAWLEIRWKLKPDEKSGMLTDSSYPFALGIFFNSVMDKFKYREELPNAQAPFSIPYLIQHRFRAQKNDWPLLQLGPGIASINFGKEYSWSVFKENTSYFRTKLLNAYEGNSLDTIAIFLRYRNVYSYDYGSKNILDFFKRLNIQISFPQNIPGSGSITEFPLDQNLTFQYQLIQPKGIGKINIASGVSHQNSQDEKQIVWDLEIGSVNQDAPDINNENAFNQWLEDAHVILHEWFFSLIEGDLFQEFSGENK